MFCFEVVEREVVVYYDGYSDFETNFFVVKKEDGVIIDEKNCGYYPEFADIEMDNCYVRLMK